MLISDLDGPCFATAPDETDPPLIVDTNTVLASSVAPKCLKAIAKR